MKPAEPRCARCSAESKPRRVYAEMADGSHETLVRGLPGPEQALYLRERLAEFLDIKGEWTPAAGTSR